MLHLHTLFQTLTRFSQTEDLENLVTGVVPILLINPHPVAAWSFLGLLAWESAQTHSGYSYPWWMSAGTIFPRWIYGGDGFHNFHHTHNVGNFGRCSYWDWICGTDTAYRNFLAKKKNEQEKSQ